MNTQRHGNKAVFFSAADVCFDHFTDVVSETTNPADCPTAADIQHGIPIYTARTIHQALGNMSDSYALKAEFARCFAEGPGVLAITGVYNDTRIPDQCNRVFDQICDAEEASKKGKGDHFGKPGANRRIWNSFQKLCEKAPEDFVRYFSNPALTFVSEAWLGPGFQMTAQLNVVRPGGAAQKAHRDYHFGFQTPETIRRYPLHLQLTSQYLTLQGAVAHSDMPVESGPTRLLPHSQKFPQGYLGMHMENIIDYFNDHYVCLPLQKGDAVFFNPALLHAAGNNTSSRDRSANLLQVSACMGRAMESVDLKKIAETVYPVVCRKRQAGELTDNELYAIIACCADGYSFPTNLDTDPPLNGSAPKTVNAFFHRAVSENMTPAEFRQILHEMYRRRLA